VVTVLVRVKHKREAYTLEVEVEMSDVTRGENDYVPRTQAENKAGLEQTQLTTNPRPKGDYHTEELVAGISMAPSRYRNVDDKPSEGMGMATFMHGEPANIHRDFLVLVR
jgi:hypothetical protein